MNRISGSIIKLVSGLIVIYLLVNTLSPGGALGNLTGMLIAKYPFHKSLLNVFSGSLGWDTSFVPVVQSSILDDLLIIMIAALILGGVSTVIKNIFNPIDHRSPDAEEYMNTTKYRFKGVLASALASVVSILVSNMIFTSIVQKVNESIVGGVLFTIIKIVLLAAMVMIFILFVKGIASGVSGKGFGIGVLAFFAIKTLIQTIVIIVMSVYVLAAIVINASGIAGPLFIIYALFVLGSFVGKSMKV